MHVQFHEIVGAHFSDNLTGNLKDWPIHGMRRRDQHSSFRSIDDSNNRCVLQATEQGNVPFLSSQKVHYFSELCWGKAMVL